MGTWDTMGTWGHHGDMEDTDSVISTPKPRLRPFFEGLSQSSSQTEISSPPPAEPGTKLGRKPPDEGGAEPDGTDTRGDPEPPQPEPGGVPEKLRTPLKGSKGGAEVTSPRGGTRRGTPLRERPLGRGVPGGVPSVPNPGDRNNSSDSERSPELGPGGQVPPPRRALWDQLGPALGPESGGVPERLLLVSTCQWRGQWVLSQLRSQGHPAVGAGGSELPAVLGALLTRIQRMCPCPPPAVTLVALGGAPWLSTLLRSLVRTLSTRSPDMGGPPGPLRLLPVGLGPHPLGPHLAALDPRYGAAFLDPPWRELFGRSEAPPTEPFDVVGRILTYAAGAGATHALPVAEAMLTRGDTRPDDDSYQKFVPFVAAVTVGQLDDPPAAPGDNDECPPPGLLVPSPSPPPGGGVTGGPREAATPPASPSMGGTSTQGSPGDALALQVDYWGGAPMGAAERRREGGERREGGAKSTLRGTFRSLHVTRLPPPGDGPAPPAPTLTLTLVTREKNKKVPTLFKRPREPDTKSLVVEGVTRLICAPRQPPLRVWVDGSPWDDIKFFQLAPSWPTHVKHLQVALWGPKAP
ncbi:phosphofurin acidic cluster sorting protein 1-like [Columba livia]|uniref:phosphofurin acidic cluster sorting protein 1-like n=1 Tax=Columba livia TaxID=8932 RepID=UPI0031BA5DDA